MTFNGTKELEFTPNSIEHIEMPSPPFGFIIKQYFEGYEESATQSDPVSGGQDKTAEDIELEWDDSILKDMYEACKEKHGDADISVFWPEYKKGQDAVNKYRRSLESVHAHIALKFLEDNRAAIEEVFNNMDVEWEQD